MLYQAAFLRLSEHLLRFWITGSYNLHKTECALPPIDVILGTCYFMLLLNEVDQTTKRTNSKYLRVTCLVIVDTSLEIMQELNRSFNGQGT